MLAALTRSQAQNVSDLRDELRRSAHEQARSVSELHVALRDGLAETVVVARQVAVEHCDRLREKVEEQLREVKEETAERVDVLREEMSELRAAVQQQAASQPWAEQAAGGEERPAPLVKKDDQWGTQSEPGDVRAWVAAGCGCESRAPLTAPGAPTWVPYHPSQPAPITPPRTPSPPLLGCGAQPAIAPPRTSPPPLLGCGAQPVLSPWAAGGALGRRKPAEFDGRVAWEAYKAQFELLAQGRGWSSEEMALQLVASLRGPALEILAHLPPAHRSSYEKMAGALQQRFGSPYLSEVYRARLKARVRQQDESLPQLALDVETLVRRAYPAAPEEMVVVLARDSFVDALQDPRVQMYVKQAHPVDLQAALAQALEYEAFTRSTRGAMAAAPEPTSPRRHHFQARRARTQQAATGGSKAAGPREFRGACWQCGQVGHRRSECKTGRKTRSLDDLRTRSPTRACCWNCGQQGHRRSSCTQLKDMMMVGGNMDRLGAGAAAQPPTVEPHST